MFTGIIGELGHVETLDAGKEGARIRIRAGISSELAPGDSVAVNGACLTAAATENGFFEADVMHQTLSLTTLGELESGAPVNLELPLRLTDRLGGHVVRGHVDGTGTVEAVTEDGFARRLQVKLPDELLAYSVERGSIAIEGVSLTIATLEEGEVEVSLIPETLERTTLGRAQPGDRVNVECDVLARYVRRMLPSVTPLDADNEQ